MSQAQSRLQSSRQTKNTTNMADDASNADTEQAFAAMNGDDRQAQLKQSRKLAQHRYYMKNKAKLQQLQDQVDEMTVQLQELEGERKRRQELELQLAMQRSLPAPQLVQQPAQPLPVPRGGLPSLDQIKAAYDILQQEIKLFVDMHALGKPLAAALMPIERQNQLQTFIRTSIDLLKAMIQVASTDILEASALSESVAPIFWQQVVVSSQLSVADMNRVVEWRKKILANLESCYNERLALKTKVLQVAVPDDPQQASAQQHWAELLMLKAAGYVGFTAPLQVSFELAAMLEELSNNLKVEKSVAAMAVEELLTTILNPVQAIQYLLAAQHIAWDSLAFAQGCANAAAAQ